MHIVPAIWSTRSPLTLIPANPLLMAGLPDVAWRGLQAAKSRGGSWHDFVAILHPTLSKYENMGRNLHPARDTALNNDVFIVQCRGRAGGTDQRGPVYN